MTRMVSTLVAGLALLAGTAVVAPTAGAAPTGLARAPMPGVDPDPGALGPQAVDELSYDLGDLAFRPDGFPAAVEVKAQVFAPQTIAGEAPVVVLQHGRHATCATDELQTLEWPCPSELPEIPSYQGYGALGRLLASHGAIVVSIGANGINAVDGYVSDSGASARAQLVLEHLRLWQVWGEQASGPFGTRFVGHVDTATVGLMGHSRGGEGVVAAAQLNQRRGSPYGIKAVVALAPVDFARRLLGGVPLQVVLPFCDGDVSDLQGAAYYDDARYGSPGDTTAKQTTLVHGANHNFFNTVWTSGPGSADDAEWLFLDGPAPSAENCRPNGPGRLSGPQQEAAGATIMGGFLRRYVFDDAAFEPFVTGVTARPASVGPARYTVAHHGGARLELGRWVRGDDARLGPQRRPSGPQAASSGLVCAGGQGTTEGEGLAFCPGEVPLVNPTAALDVGWVTPTAVVRADLPPAGVDVTAYDGVRFRVAFPPDDRNDRRSRQGASLRIVDATGASSTVDIGTWSPAFARRPVSIVRHTVLNGVRVPLSAFAGVDLTKVRAVEVRFDRTSSGRALVSDLALTAEGTGERVGPPEGAATTGPLGGSCLRSSGTRWGCALASVVWGREAWAGDELEDLARTFAGSASARGIRVNIIVRGPSAGRVAVGRPAQALFGDGYFEEELPSRIAAAGGVWEEALVRMADGVLGATGATASPGGAVDAIYVALVGRLPGSEARTYWSAQLRQRGGGARLARALVASPERAERVVAERYRQILGRNPDAGGRAHWVPVLRKSGGEQTLVSALLRTPEFTQRALA